MPAGQVAREPYLHDEVIAIALARRDAPGQLARTHDGAQYTLRALLEHLSSPESPLSPSDHGALPALLHPQGAPTGGTLVRLGHEVYGCHGVAFGRRGPCDLGRRPTHAFRVDAQKSHHGGGLGARMPQQGEQHLDDEPIAQLDLPVGGDTLLRRAALPAARQLLLPHTGLRMEVHIHRAHALSGKLARTHEGSQRIVDPHPEPVLQLAVGGSLQRLAHPAAHGGSQAAVYGEVDIAPTPEPSPVVARRHVERVEATVVVVAPSIRHLPKVAKRRHGRHTAQRRLDGGQVYDRLGGKESLQPFQRAILGHGASLCYGKDLIRPHSPYHNRSGCKPPPGAPQNPSSQLNLGHSLLE